MKLCIGPALKPQQTTLEQEQNEDYYDSLQKYSTLYRILLSRPYVNEIRLQQWNRIDLKIVNELGLTLKGSQRKNCWLQVDCKLLVEKKGNFVKSVDYQVQCRPVQHDAWEFNTDSDIAGFCYSTNGDLEYAIVSNENNRVSPSCQFYIQILPTCQRLQTLQAFPLVIGPIKIVDDTDNKNSNGLNGWGREVRAESQDSFHSCSIPDQSYLMIKEKWELGTPGKMWDSALVISQMISDVIKTDPSRFSGHHILDLSAGTGCVALLIALLYKKIYNKDKSYLPKITITDLSEALDLIYQNRRLNQLESYTNVRELRWGNYDDAQRILSEGSINTIIASDVLYEPASFSKLVQTLDWLSSDSPLSSVDIFLGYKRRGLSREEEQSFFDICAEKFDIITLHTQAENKLITNGGWIINDGFSNIFKETGVHIYQLVRKS